MKKINVNTLIDKAKELVKQTCYDLPEDVYNSLKIAKEKETKDTPKEVLKIMIKNADIARAENLPICQDTGFAIFFVDLPENFFLEGKLEDILERIYKSFERQNKVSKETKSLIEKDKSLLKNYEKLKELLGSQDEKEKKYYEYFSFEKYILSIENKPLLEVALEQAAREGYIEGYLRKSIVCDPLFDRKNTLDNTPCIIHIHLTKDKNLKIGFMPKGGGSENMSILKMLKPADGVEGVKNLIIETVKNAGPNPCPPIIVGVGIGGTFDFAPSLAKKALLRPLGRRNPNPIYAKLEEELLKELNKLNIGPGGFGGKTTVLDVKIEYFPCHIATLPVAINIQCHAARYREIIL